MTDRLITILISVLAAGLLGGCLGPEPAAALPAPSASPPVTATPALATAAATPPLAPPASPSPASTPSPSATAAPPLTICSPLEGISLADLNQPDLLKNPFDPPAPGLDSGHYGVDFAYWSRGERDSMLGLPVYAALPGRVAGLVLDRPPYGNAVIIETALDLLPASWLQLAAIPGPAPTIVPDSTLICPDAARFGETGPGRSLYILYAHMQETPLVEIDQMVACGQQIGKVGTTGRSVNPHLHLETRVGPSGATFTRLAHYTNAAIPVEMANYCAWRVSGLFQAFDPLGLLSLQP